MAQITVKSLTISGVILVIACLGVAYFGATPQWNKYSQNKTQLTYLKDNNTKLNDALDSVQGFLSSYQNHQSSVSLTDLALPVKTPNIADFMSSVGDMAQASGLVLSTFTIENSNVPVQTTAQDNVITPLTFTLSASGGFPAFKAFILRLESFLRIVDIDHVNIRNDQNGNIQYQLHLQTYYQK